MLFRRILCLLAQQLLNADVCAWPSSSQRSDVFGSKMAAPQNKAINVNDASDAGDDMHTKSKFLFACFACYYNFRYTIQSPTNIKLQTQTTAHWIEATTKNSATASAATTKQCVNLCEWWSHRQHNKTVWPVFSCERDRRRKTTSEKSKSLRFRLHSACGGLPVCAFIAWKQQKYQTKHKKFRSFLWRMIYLAGSNDWCVCALRIICSVCLWLLPDVEKARWWNSLRRSHLVLTLTASHVFSLRILLFLFTPFFVDACLITYRRTCNYSVNTGQSEINVVHSRKK